MALHAPSEEEYAEEVKRQLKHPFPTVTKNESLQRVIQAIARAVTEIAYEIRTEVIKEVGTANQFGDAQLTIDVVSNELVFRELKACGVVAVGASEETPEETQLRGKGYCVAFDPLDGSSIIAANLSVGSIFGVWEGDHLVGRTGKEQVASAIAMYGPRTELTIAIAAQGVSEFTLDHDARWHCTTPDVKIAPSGRIFAPGNLRCTAYSAAYRDLINFWISNKYTLRYSGGMVPDCHHILSKGKGVFCNYGNADAPFKLRLLYEVAPIAFLIKCAGGAVCDEVGRPVLDLAIGLDTRCGVCLGSREEVDRYISYMSPSE
mmetsp:Transcript_9181/g.25745  ORF Transcript_9181/g.25745 Transcript_9181/m.25745 type:complete len:319 (-) Transcript_9181:19-975(-)